MKINPFLNFNKVTNKQDFSSIYSYVDNIKTLKDLNDSLIKFRVEYKERFEDYSQNLVFGDGNCNAQIMLIGEAPGAQEDLLGIPFCGRSGKLLDQMLLSIDLSREKNVYITNTVFWRPNNNRRPTKEEICLCRPFLEKYINIINPKLIILVGTTAVESVLDNQSPITKIRGAYYQYKNKFLTSCIPTTAIYHPAYLLRKPDKKIDTWEDLRKIKNEIIKLSI